MSLADQEALKAAIAKTEQELNKQRELLNKMKESVTQAPSLPLNLSTMNMLQQRLEFKNAREAKEKADAKERQRLMAIESERQAQEYQKALELDLPRRLPLAEQIFSWVAQFRQTALCSGLFVKNEWIGLWSCFGGGSLYIHRTTSSLHRRRSAKWAGIVQDGLYACPRDFACAYSVDELNRFIRDLEPNGAVEQALAQYVS